MCIFYFWSVNVASYYLPPPAMGYYLRANRTVWTFFVIIYTSISAVTPNNHPHHQNRLLADLGLNKVPNRANINISLEEYTTVITQYLAQKDDSESVPSLRVYKLDKMSSVQQNTSRSIKMYFPVRPSYESVQNAALRLLLPPQPGAPEIIQVQLNQILGARRRHILHQGPLYLSSNRTKWCDMDITEAVSNWFRGEANLGLELVCLDCKNNLMPNVAAITSLTYLHRRTKRSVRVGRTDCSNRHTIGRGKKKCCRHELNVEFTSLGFSEMSDIVYPKSYDAGYCHGMCPPNYNMATNHSRIQGLIHKLHKRDSKLALNKTGLVPKTCCAPSKLMDLEIVKEDSDNPGKLKREKWQNMIVIECACS